LRKNEKTVLICGAGHSGSTLLGMIIGSRDDAMYCGEMAKSRYFFNESAPLRKKICSLCGETCQVWNKYENNLSIDLYEQLSRISGKHIIVDSTKRVSWIEEQLNTLNLNGGNPFLVFLIRDGRAVVNSRIRKYPDMDCKKIIENWKEQILKTEEMYEGFDGKKIIIKYEDLCADPEISLRNVCSLLQIDYNQSMLDYTSYHHHPLGSNKGTNYLVAKNLQNSLSINPLLRMEREDYYKKNQNKIILDERWKKELKDSVKESFEDIAGELNKKLSYQ